MNKVLKCIPVILALIMLGTPAANAQARNQQAMMPSDTAQSCQPPDARDVENVVRMVEEGMTDRAEEEKMTVTYERVKSKEMEKCEEIKSEIWNLKERIARLTDSEQKLWRAKQVSDSEVAALTRQYEQEENAMKGAIARISSTDSKIQRMLAMHERDVSARKKNLQSLKDQLKDASGRMKDLANEKIRIEKDLSSGMEELKAQGISPESIEEKPTLGRRDSQSQKTMADETKNGAGGPAADIRNWENARQKVSADIMDVSKECSALEEEILSLENEIALKTREVRIREAEFDEVKKDSKMKAEAIKRMLPATKTKLDAALDANKKIEADLSRLAAEHLMVEEAIKVKTEELKVRISVLVSKEEQNRLLSDTEELSPAVRKAGLKEEELGAKIKVMFKAMTDENNRLIAENKAILEKLRKAEESALDAKRKARAAEKIPEELKVKLDKERVDMHFNLAVVYEKNGLYRDAEREYLKCLSIDPSDSGVHYNLGILYDDKLNMNDKAMNHYYKFLALRPMGETAERVRDWITKLELENRLGKEMR